MWRGRFTLASLAAISMASCAEEDVVSSADVGLTRDATPSDTRSDDVPEADSDTPDSGTPDAGPTDSGPTDVDVAESAPPLPTITPHLTREGPCDAPPEAPMAFPMDAPRYALNVFHFNLQYVAGGLDGYLGVYTISDEALQDAIIVESYAPLIALYESHPTWGASFEMQGLMVEVMAKRHPEILARTRTLVQRGQIDVMSYHWSDQLVTAYGHRDMRWSWDENQAIFDATCLPRAPVHFLQEGQFGPGIQSFAGAKGELVILPRNLMKFFHDPVPSGLWFDNRGYATITTDGQNQGGIELAWTFVDDGEILATAGANPYLPDVFKANDKAVADYEAKLLAMESEDVPWVHVPVSHYVKVLKAKGVAKTPIEPPILDGSWQPKGSDNMHLWMGGTGQEPGEERDNLILRTNVALSQRIAAVEQLRRRVALDGAESSLAPEFDAVLREAKRELLLAQVSDATGWRPVHTEVKYSLSHQTRAKELVDALARHALWHLGKREGAVHVAVADGAFSEEPPAVVHDDVGTPLAAAPAGLDGITAESTRPSTLTWTDHGEFVQLEVTFPATEQVTYGTAAPPAVALVIPLATDEIAYSPATEHETILRVPFTGYAFNALPAELGLPLPNGLLEIAPSWTLVLDQRTIHLAALVATDRVMFKDGTQPGHETAQWRLRFYPHGADDTLAAANALNVTPVVTFDTAAPQ